MSKLTVTADPGTPFVETTRAFAASPELLFRAYTEPDLIVRWLGPRGYAMTVHEFDVRHGGAYRYTHTGDEGEFAFRGIFHGEPSLDGITQTFEFEGMPGKVTLETLTFEPSGDMTTIRTRSVFQSVADRDGMIESGMETGMAEGYDKLDELLPELKGS